MTRPKPHSWLAGFGLTVVAALALLPWRIDGRVVAPSSTDEPCEAAPLATPRPPLPEHGAAREVSGDRPRDPQAVERCHVERHAAPVTLPVVRARDATTLADVPHATRRLEARRDDGAPTLVVEASGYQLTRRPYDADAGTAADRSIDVLLVPEGRPPGIELMSAEELKASWHSRGYSRLAKGRPARPLIVLKVD